MRSNVEVEVITVLVTQEMIVTWVDTQLAVCLTQFFLEQMTILAFLTDDIEQSIQAGEAKGERLTEVTVVWNTTVDRLTRRVTEVNDDGLPVWLYAI